MLLSSVACQHKTLEFREPVTEVEITAGISTKASGATWNADRIGVRVTDSPESDMASRYANVAYKTKSTSSGTASFSAVSKAICFADSTETVTFLSYAPYISTSSDATLPGNDGIVSASTSDQTDPEGIDFMFASEQEATLLEPQVNFTFYHEMVQVTFNIVAGDNVTAEQIREGTYTAGGLVLDGTFNTYTGETSATGSTSTLTLSGNCPYGTQSDGIAYTAILFPQTATIEFTAGLSGQTKTESIESGSYEAGFSYTHTIKISLEKTDDGNGEGNGDDGNGNGGGNGDDGNGGGNGDDGNGGGNGDDGSGGGGDDNGEGETEIVIEITGSYISDWITSDNDYSGSLGDSGD